MADGLGIQPLLEIALSHGEPCLPEDLLLGTAQAPASRFHSQIVGQLLIMSQGLLKIESALLAVMELGLLGQIEPGPEVLILLGGQAAIAVRQALARFQVAGVRGIMIEYILEAK